MNTKDLVESLVDYYGVSSYTELSEKLNVAPSTISSWICKDSTHAILKRCRKLGIHKEIFKEMIIPDRDQSVSASKTVPIEKKGDNIIDKGDNIIDPVAYGLFLEAYEKAMREDTLKAFRLHLMEF